MTFFIYLCIQERDKKFVSIKRYHCLYGIISVDFSAECVIGVIPLTTEKGAFQRESCCASALSNESIEAKRLYLIYNGAFISINLSAPMPHFSSRKGRIGVTNCGKSRLLSNQKNLFIYRNRSTFR